MQTGSSAPERRVRTWNRLSAEIIRRAAGDGVFRLTEHVLIMPLTEVRSISRCGDGPAQELRFGRHNFAFFPAGVRRWRLLDEPVDVAAVYQPPELFQEVAVQLDTASSTLAPIIVGHDPLITEIVLTLVRELETPGAGTGLLVEALGHALAVRLLQSAAARKPDRFSHPQGVPIDRVRRVIEHIDAFLGTDLTLQELASIARLSPNHFSRTFKAAIGCAPHQFVLRRRVERARRLLLDTDLPLAEIANACGFAGPSQFTSRFRTETGITPGAFRRQR